LRRCADRKKGQKQIVVIADADQSRDVYIDADQPITPITLHLFIRATA
jgi:hypothetical protein